MTYAELVKKFIAKVMQIYNSNPKRREPGDGSDGYCDCIGLIIGAIRRLALKWLGIHGSNWAARKETINLQPIKSQSQLQVGDVVYKAVPKGHKNWALPSRYKKGGKYYNGDLNDYYHAGVVESTSPFRIRHMSAKMTTDTTVNTYYPWNYFGKLRQLVEAACDMVPIPASPTTPAPGKQGVLVAPSGSTVNFRRTPSLRGVLLKQIKLGTVVDIVTPGEEWCKVKYDGVEGYMMAKFIDIVGDGKGQY